MGLGFDGPGGATAAMGGAVVRTGIMVDSVKGGGGYEGLGWVGLKNETAKCGRARGIGQKGSDT